MKFKDTHYGDLTGQVYKGSINVKGMKLTSLEGAPRIVHGDFSCVANPLETLEGGPEKDKGDFSCNSTNITSLKGAPEEVGGDFDCSKNKLTRLTGISKKIGGNVKCDDNPNKHLDKEYQIRKENPDISENEVKAKMLELGYHEYYLSDEVKDVFFV